MSVANEESSHARPSFGDSPDCRQRAFYDGHADGYTVADLFEDGGLSAIGHARGEFKSANDRARMHHHCGGRLCGEALAG